MISLAFARLQQLRSAVRRLYHSLARQSLLLVFFAQLAAIAAVGTQDSNAPSTELHLDPSHLEAQTPGVPQDEPADIGPGIFVLVMLVLFLAACFVALLLGIFAALILAGVITGGIISASLLTAVLSRSISSGFRALFLQIGAVFGLIAGAGGAMIFIWLAKIPSDSLKPWAIGLLAGLLWGILSAALFNFAWGRTVAWISAKLQRSKPELTAPNDQRTS